MKKLANQWKKARFNESEASPDDVMEHQTCRHPPVQGDASDLFGDDE